MSEIGKRGAFVRKTVESVQKEVADTRLKRRLGPIQLTMIGIGCIIGAGVYVMTGTAAANYAGPAVVVSFLIAALACTFIGLCYAELSSVLPASGASYTYAYVVLGEAAAWALGWMVMFEFGLAGAALAVGFSGYLQSLLGDFGVHLPAVLSQPLIKGQMQNNGMIFHVTPSINLVAAGSLAVAAAILIRGISHSAAVNTLLVVVKVSVLLGFVLVGFGHVDTANWTPFLPHNEGGFRYGVIGVFRAASLLFFAYLGFEAVATAAAEARRPQRDIPIGILCSLAVSTLAYICVALVLTGLVSYRTLDVPDPIAVAVAVIGKPVIAIAIKVGALTGLASVLIMNTYGQSRICFAIANDGLLPDRFGRVHPRFSTPAFCTAVIAAISAIASALLPISLLADLVSLGTVCVFSVVAICVMWLRTTRPDLPRPFKVPFGGVRVRGVWIGTVPVLALVASFTMMGPVLLDIGGKALAGQWIPGTILVTYLAIGALIYLLYGRKHSRSHAAMAGSSLVG